MTPDQIMTPILRCPEITCRAELKKRIDGKYICLEKTCPEFKKEKTPEEIISAYHHAHPELKERWGC